MTPELQEGGHMTLRLVPTAKMVQKLEALKSLRPRVFLEKQVFS
jgi:hypothetical protein